MIGLKLVIGLLLFSIVYALQLYFNKNIWLKIVAITILFVISSMAYFSFETYKGWPTSDKLPKAMVYDIQITQPSKNFAGAIYVWAVPAEQKKLTFIEKIVTYIYEFKNAPRAYYVPYTKATGKLFGDAQKKLKQGFVVTVEGEAGEGEGTERGKGKYKDQNGGDARDYDVPNLLITSPDNMLRKN